MYHIWSIFHVLESSCRLMSLYQKFFVKTTKPKKPKKPKNVKYFKNLFYQHLAINKLAPY